MDRVEQYEVQVEADGGMLREQHQEKRDAYDTCCQHQQYVPSQQGTLPPPLCQEDKDADEQQ